MIQQLRGKTSTRRGGGGLLVQRGHPSSFRECLTRVKCTITRLFTRCACLRHWGDTPCHVLHFCRSTLDMRAVRVQHSVVKLPEPEYRHLEALGRASAHFQIELAGTALQHVEQAAQEQDSSKQHQRTSTNKMLRKHHCFVEQAAVHQRCVAVSWLAMH